MNREQFLRELKYKIRNLPQEEIDNALSYYNEYFDDAGAENESKAITELGSPSRIADELISEFATVNVTQKPNNVKNRLSVFWIAVAAVCASPILVPLSFAFIMVVFALGFAGFMVIFAFGLAAFMIAVAGILMFAVSLVTLFTHFPTGLMLLGLALITTGIGTILCVFISAATKATISGLTKLMSRFLSRRASHEAY